MIPTTYIGVLCTMVQIIKCFHTTQQVLVGQKTAESKYKCIRKVHDQMLLKKYELGLLCATRILKYMYIRFVSETSSCGFFSSVLVQMNIVYFKYTNVIMVNCHGNLVKREICFYFLNTSNLMTDLSKCFITLKYEVFF